MDTTLHPGDDNDKTVRIDAAPPSSATDETQRIDSNAAGAGEAVDAGEGADAGETAFIDPVPEEREAQERAHDDAMAKLYDEPAEQTYLAAGDNVPRWVAASEEEAASEERSRQRRRTARVVAAVAAVLAVAYVGVALLFTLRFMPNTTVNGQDVSWMSKDDLAAQIHGYGEDYEFTVEGDGLELSASGADIGLSYDGQAYANRASAHINCWLWPYELTQAHDIQIDKPVTIDEDLLVGVLKKPVAKLNKKAVSPTDASIAFDEKKDEFAIQEEKVGTELDTSAVTKRVEEGVSQLLDTVTLGESELKQPKVKSDDPRLGMGLQKANDFAKTKITLTVDGKKAYKVTAKTIAGWVEFDDEFSPSVALGPVTAWAQGPLSRKFDTVGAKRTYKAKYGKKVTVSGGTYGWVIDGAALAEDITERVNAGEDGKLEIPMIERGTKWNPGGADWKRYIDIDLTQQHARMYDDKGKLIWESDVVSGQDTKKRRTPTGVYVINWKGRNQKLIGSDENGDGKPDYESKVSYWMPFVENTVALHDAPWRGSFGGSVYKSNGSHGCVNLPASKAAQLYKIVREGDVVSCHK